MSDSGKKISVLGALIITLSLFLGDFVEYRPNRVLTGTFISARKLFGNNFFLLIFLSVLIVVLAVANHKKYKLLIGFTSLLLVGVVLYLLGIVIIEEAYNIIPNGRISLGIGFWAIFLGIEMVMSGCFKGDKKCILHRRLFYTILILMVFVFLLSGHLNNLSIMKEFFNRSNTFFKQIGRHLSLSFFSVATGLVIGIPLGILIYKEKKMNRTILFLINLGQTIPTLSLLGLIMVPLAMLSQHYQILKVIGISGVGFTPAFIVLIIYALFPVVHNTIAGLKMIDSDLVEAAIGLGMKDNQIFWKVQFPLSLPIILGGIRIAMTQSIGNTILAGLIGGGGLGSIIFLGLAQAAPDLILLGVIPLIAMAFIMDSIISFLIFYSKKKYLGLTE